jgi:hypothetical protein
MKLLAAGFRETKSLFWDWTAGNNPLIYRIARMTM